MDKEIEALKNLFDSNCENSHEDYDLIYHALRELKSIKEANPSEALRKLDTIRHLEIGFDKNGKPITLNNTNGLNIIEQALLKAQEQKKALEIIKEKGIDVGFLKTCKDVKEYNYYCFDEETNKTLTTEEFNLIKEILKCI
jgi:hypothetical protein